MRVHDPRPDVVGHHEREKERREVPSREFAGEVSPRVDHDVGYDPVMKIEPSASERGEGALVREDDRVHENDGDHLGKTNESSPEHRGLYGALSRSRAHFPVYAGAASGRNDVGDGGAPLE